MADISNQIDQIRNATLDEEVKEAIASALEALSNADQSESITNLKATLMDLSDKLNSKADLSAVNKEILSKDEIKKVKELKDVIDDITRQLSLKASNSSVQEIKAKVENKADRDSTEKELGLKATKDSLNVLSNKVNELSSKISQTEKPVEFKMTKSAPSSTELLSTSEGQRIIRDAVEQYATENLVNILRGYVNEQLALKADQQDFDLIVGNGFQGWTITDYIIRIREDYNTALATMATKADLNEIADRTVEEAGNAIKVGGEIEDSSKVFFDTDLERLDDEVTLLEQSDLDAAILEYHNFFSYIYKPVFEIGTIDEHGFVEESSDTARTDGFLNARDFTTTVPNGYKMKIVAYDKYKLLIDSTMWKVGAVSFNDYSITGCEYLKLLVMKLDESDIESSDLTALNAGITLNVFGTDWTEENLKTAIDITPVNAVKARTSTLENKTASLENRATVLEANTAAADADISTIFDRLSMVDSAMAMRPNRVDLGEDNILYFYCDDVMLYSAGPFVSGSGEWSGGGSGGGGGATTNAVMDARNTSGFITTDIAYGDSITLSFNWSSIEDEMPTGDGSMTVYVNGTTRINRGISQGDVTFDPSRWFKAGKNEVYIMIEDTYSQRRYIKITVNAINLSVKVNLDTSTPHEGAFDIGITPSGDVEKTIHTKVDNTELETEVTSLNDRTISKTIPALSHGPHTIEVWVTAEINGGELESVHVTNEVIAIESGNPTPIIISNFTTTNVVQYTNINVLYRVYDPTALTTRINRLVNNVDQGAITVDRTEQNWAYRAMTPGETTLTITCKNVSKSFTFTVVASEASITPVEDNLALYLTAEGRSNGEDHPEVWEYEDISATLTGFNFISNGFITDNDGNSVLSISGGASVTIPYQIFREDARSTGLTVEVEFSTRNVRNYDTAIFTCMSGNRGINITAQKATLKSEQIEISTSFKEDEHVRISFVVEKRSDNRLVNVYINGVWSGVVQYPDGDDFSQISPVGITIGSNDCTIDIYCIRVYTANLTERQILSNYIADRQDVDEMLALYDNNNIFNAYGDIDISALPSNLPYLILNTSGTHLPRYKGDKVTVSGRFVNPSDSSKSFEFTGAEADVQGTSSQYYARKNFKIKFKEGFIVNGVGQTKYAMNSDAIATKTFTFKKDVASSEGANNVELVRLYNKICPYKTPAQEENSKVRQGIDGFPIVIFEDNGEEVKFIGKYNFNNDKGTEEVFGLVEGDESWEVLNNTSNRVLFKDNNFSDGAWLKDFEARYPDTKPPYEDYTQLKELIEEVMSIDTATATGDTLSESVTLRTTQYTWNQSGDVVTRAATSDVTFNTDSVQYRLARFQNEVDDYFAKDSLIFYYLFTELFLMVDSRAKNMFPSFMGASVDE